MRHLHKLDSLVPGRYSTVLLEDLALIHAEGGSSGAIVAEIEHLESPSLVLSHTKPAAPLTKKLLCGLWHKHYQLTTSPSFLLNLQNEVRLHEPELEEMVRAALSARERSDFVGVRQAAAEIASALVSEPYDRRRADRRLTGEWIVYVPHNGQNFYLCLAVHREDKLTRQKVERAIDQEWPFLGSVLTWPG
ncbi:hypothetical protein [Achromobacter sp. UBA2119]|uniref:hypothetical protein n=1 Tax=Achromobacter sp. UBA2119 TaxID=1945911 RepID=UPI00257B9B25|nr:hypothetical protein [Achromobacter sp. UBA2119]